MHLVFLCKKEAKGRFYIIFNVNVIYIVTSPVYRSVYVFLSVSVQEKVRPEFILIGDPEI